MADDFGSVSFEPAEPEIDVAQTRVMPVMRAYEPSTRDKIAQWIMGSGQPTDSRRNFAEGVMGTSGLGNQTMGLVDLTPAGIPLAAEEAKRDAAHGNWLGASLNAMAMIPAAKPAALAAKAAPAVARELNALNMYSHGSEAARSLPQATGTPEQMKAMLLKAGTKPDEFAHAAWDDFVKGKSTMTADEAAELLQRGMPRVEESVLKNNQDFEDLTREIYENNRDRSDPPWHRLDPEEREEMIRHHSEELAYNDPTRPTKYHSYQIPGGENYREVLLRNSNESPARKELQEIRARIENDEEVWKNPTLHSELAARRDELKNKIESEGALPEYRSSHWDEPNVLAHMRMSDRIGPEGQKILHLEELQSDWAQGARKSGFSGSPLTDLEKEEFNNLTEKLKISAKTRDPSLKATPEEVMRYNQLADKNYSNTRGIPRGPYVDNTQKWTDLGLKRALTEAARGGYDQLMWTPGAEQAKRYGLSNHYTKLGYAPEEQVLFAWPKDYGMAKRIEVGPDKLADYIGAEQAAKLLAAPKDAGTHILTGADLEMGGEGMKGYYDKIIPNQLAKLVKKLDPEAKIGSTKIGDNKKEAALIEGFIKENPNFYGLNYLMENGRDLPSALKEMGIKADWDDFLTSQNQNLAGFPSINITPRMREEILKGFPHFADGGVVKEPTEAQKQAGNYKKGHISVHGLEISVENPKGSMRRGQSKSGKKWECRMPADYGYFKSTTGADGDHVDVYVGPNKKADRAFVIDQLENGHFDEHKVMLGYNLKSEAVKDYCNAFSDGKGRQRIGNIQELPVSKLKEWLKSRHTKKPIEDAPRRFLAGA